MPARTAASRSGRIGAGIAAKANDTIFFSPHAGLAAAFRRPPWRRFDQRSELERDIM